MAWYFLSLGLLVGGWWSYHVLGWGGYRRADKKRRWHRRHAIATCAMRRRSHWRWFILAVLITLFIVLGYLGVGEWRDGSRMSVAVTMPPLSDQARAGREAFDRLCAACHGTNAAGSAVGPPLVHRIYGLGHHADVAFVLAAQRGVRAHHWRLGDMPPQPSARVEEVELIVRYVRELQRANGIE